MSWRKNAACRGLPVDLFMPGRGEFKKMRDAKAICETCPVINECRDESIQLAQDVDLDGIYAGWTKNERRRFMLSQGLTVRRFGYSNVPTTKIVREVKNVHGTETAYHNHVLNGETPCEDCQTRHDERRARAAAYKRKKRVS